MNNENPRFSFEVAYRKKKPRIERGALVLMIGADY
jgi:hypothetical protein